MENDFQKYMQRCIDLAKLGERRVSPNPMVGSVIVSNGKIIGEGYHCVYGRPHAEVNAINAVNDKELLKDATLFVNLEPCAHFGKTPPCSDLIVEMKIPRVVIGTVDPFAEVAGKGIEKLKKAGCDVSVGVLHEECLELNRRFFTFHRKKRPYIILKWAQTADGFVDYDRTSDEFGQPSWITNEMARIAVHKQRSTETAIFIGTETALRDNPSLTLRDWYGKQPLRVVTDRRHRLPTSLNLFDGKNETHVLSFSDYPENRNALLVKHEQGNDTLDELLQHLYSLSVQSVIVEGGSTMLQSFIDRNLWDEAHVYIGQITFGKGILAPVFHHSPLKFDRFYNSELRVYRNKLV
jgi:diaminohydroxyphosphoribosylaminopyrimidine deaminase/5-amino-6-(5-phosphoribosylamino)uracil reductase